MFGTGPLGADAGQELQDLVQGSQSQNKVFSKTKDSSLLPHSLYNFALDFLPGLFLPEGHLYSLSTPKREAMDQYIKDFLGVGDRQHPMSLQRLLGTKKYHCKKLYPLTLLSSGLELFQGPSILEVQSVEWLPSGPHPGRG